MTSLIVGHFHSSTPAKVLDETWLTEIEIGPARPQAPMPLVLAPLRVPL